MPISTKTFNAQSLAGFHKLTGQIQEAQMRIASGKKILRSSDSPIAATNISAAKEQKILLDRYSSNLDRAQYRLALTDQTLGQAVTVMTRIFELSIQAVNDTYSTADRESIKAEIGQLKKGMVELANKKDLTGQSLFAGYKVNSNAFEIDKDGVVQFIGDRGTHEVQVSESMRIQTGIDGASAFMRVQSDYGHESTFEIIELVENQVESGTLAEGTLDDISKAIDHISRQQTLIGAQLSKADMQADALGQRKLLLNENISDLEDADIASIVTQMQSLITSRDAAQQAFVNIGRQSLFDFMR
ncbi:flagellar hook-associated protein FlgL [Alphaproteobacteria bacterium]|nr:flagellar hook-associated protein FlgL [Alphaproteobacteria bacterium]